MEYYNDIISSNIKTVGHDEEDQLLEITFKSGGTYWYQNFNRADLAEFMNAESKGKHFHKYIKDKKVFPCTKVSNYVQDVEFEAIHLANKRLVGKPGYLNLNVRCQKYGWDFLETWDKTLGRTLWYDRQNDEYKLAVEERISKL